VLALKQQPGKDISVGSLSIASQLSDLGLIDEYYFVVHPVVAGKGPRLFDTMKPRERLLLDFIDLKTLKSGVVALHYRKHA
jgi:dihydrofolate reductase